MKFDDLFPLVLEGEFGTGDKLKLKEIGPCWHCNELTCWLEINYGEYLCSEECLAAKDREFFQCVD